MTRLEDAALRVLRDLGEEGHRGALVGGLAVSARATPRTTRDVDFAVAVTIDVERGQQVLFTEYDHFFYITNLSTATCSRIPTRSWHAGTTRGTCSGT